MKPFFLCLLIATSFPACSAYRDHSSTQRHYQPAVADPVAPGELYDFIAGVARNRTTQEGTVNGARVRGVFSGAAEACATVGVINLEASHRKNWRADNYRVCGSRITLVSEEVTPSYPNQPDAVAALENARRNALLYGSQSVNFQNYQIHTRRLGVTSSRPCLPVETVVSYQGSLVLQDVKEVCQ